MHGHVFFFLCCAVAEEGRNVGGEEESLEGGRNVRKQGVKSANEGQGIDDGGHLSRRLLCVYIFHVSILLYILCVVFFFCILKILFCCCFARTRLSAIAAGLGSTKGSLTATTATTTTSQDCLCLSLVLADGREGQVSLFTAFLFPCTCCCCCLHTK